MGECIEILEVNGLVYKVFDYPVIEGENLPRIDLMVDGQGPFKTNRVAIIDLDNLRIITAGLTDTEKVVSCAVLKTVMEWLIKEGGKPIENTTWSSLDSKF